MNTYLKSMFIFRILNEIYEKHRILTYNINIFGKTYTQNRLQKKLKTMM